MTAFARVEIEAQFVAGNAGRSFDFQDVFRRQSRAFVD